MVDVELLKKEIENTGISITKICEKSGILRETYYNRLNEPSKFTASEIENLCDACGFSNRKRADIFFAK